MKVPGRVWREGYEGFLDIDFSGKLAAIEAPTLVVWGDSDALLAIFGGQAGGWPQVFSEGVVENMLGLEFAPIELEIADDLSSWRISVPGKAEGSTELLIGPTSRSPDRLAVLNPPGSEVGPGQGAATYGIATTDRVDAFGHSWERSGRSSKHIPFEWSSEDEF
jgi:hypothetical protein